MIYEFTPTQDLNGYDKPWPAGGGKNKLYSLETSYTFPADASTRPSIGTVNMVTGNTYVISYYQNTTMGSNTRNTLSVFYDNEEHYEYATANRRLSSGRYSWAYTAQTTGEVTIKLWLNAPDVTVTCDRFMVNEGNTLEDYSPYSNECPLTGFNIWNPLTEDYTQVYAGYVNSNTRELLLRPVYPEYSGEELVGPWMSSFDEYAEDITPTEGAFVVDLGGELTSYEITPFMLQTLLDSLGIRQHFTNGAGLLNSLMDQAQGRVRSEEELLHLSRPLKVIPIGDQLPAGITFKPISKDVLPGLPGKFIR